MLENKDKMIMLYLYDVCKDSKTRLIPAGKIVEFVSKKYVLSLYELEMIMLSLKKDNYIDYVASESKKGLTYCVSLKEKGKVYRKDLKKQQKNAIITLARTVGLAVLSFFVGLILKALFS